MTDLIVSSAIEENESAILDLSQSFFEIDSVSTLKAGFFGYFVSSLAHIAASSTFHRNILHKESYLNTMSLPSSVYNIAKQYNYIPALAKPSEATILVSFSYTELIDELLQNNGIIVIPKASKIFLSSVEFLTFTDISIRLIGTNNIECFYNLDNKDFDLGIQNEFIRTFVSNNQETGEQVIFIEIKVVQAKQYNNLFEIVNLNSLSNTFYTVQIPSSQQLAGFKVYYAENPTKDFEEIPVFFNENNVIDEPKYCFYTLDENNDLSIYFDLSTNKFRPAYNSRLQIVYYTTIGSEGNFNFVGSGISNVHPTLQSGVSVISNPSNGSDTETLLETKKVILSKILSRDSIAIEKDLEDFLNSVNVKTNTSKNKVTFIKKRDDVVSRLFNGFILMEDTKGRVVPSNTANVEIELADLELRNWSIKPGETIVYDKTIDKYRLLYPNEFADQVANEPGFFIYSVPFLMSFKLTPFPRLTYYINTVNQTEPVLTYSGKNSTSDSFILSNLNLQRTAILSNQYEISFNINTNISTESLYQNCIVRLTLTNENGQVVGYRNLQSISGTNIYKLVLVCNDNFDTNGNLLLENSLVSSQSNLVLSSASISENVKISLELFYSSNTINSEVDLELNSKSYYSVRKFECQNLFKFYISLDHVMVGDLAITDNLTAIARKVPLFGSNFFMNPSMNKLIIQNYTRLQQSVSDSFEKLHSNTSVDLKMYNTYGPSATFTSVRTNLSLSFDISAHSSNLEDLRKQIQNAIASFVKNSNENINSRFSISNLITHLEQTFPQIIFIRFTGINNSLSQSVELGISQEILKQNNNRVPEFLNVGTLFKNSLLDDPYEADVLINFV